VVNHYGQLAMEHWRAHRPDAFAALTNPNTYFQRLGEEIQAAITSLRDDLLSQVGNSTMADIGPRARQAQVTAEEVVLAELLWRPAEPAPSQPDSLLDEHYRLLERMNAAISSTSIE
jgi:hypothetical protein